MKIQTRFRLREKYRARQAEKRALMQAIELRQNADFRNMSIYEIKSRILNKGTV